MQASSNRKLPPGFTFLWLLLTVIWFASNSSTQIAALLTGAGSSAMLSYLFTSRIEAWGSLRFSPTRLYHFITYLAVLLVEIMRANIGMLRHIYSPRITISPGIVEIKTSLKSRVARLALANSIALTPGSLVVDIKGDTLRIHWLDVVTKDPEQARELLASPFEELLEKVFD
jgi:multicomponent Na+:H+ antiporter subunit E